MTRQAYQLTMPDRLAGPVVVASPHSGRNYDWAFMSSTVLDHDRIRSSEDAFVDILLSRVPALGLPLLAAGMPRAFLDLNRAPEELDPAVVQDVPRGSSNPRVTSGLGVIPRVVAQGRAIYRGKITHKEARDRIDTVWRPYHRKLAELMDNAHSQFGRAILLDMHSMPHEAIETNGPKGRIPEIVLGDRFGAAAGSEIVDELESIFVDLGFRVARNAPFAGANTVQAYGDPDRGRHAVQVEIDRALYMDEVQVEPNQRFDTIRDLLTQAVGRISAASGSAKLAAE